MGNNDDNNNNIKKNDNNNNNIKKNNTVNMPYMYFLQLKLHRQRNEYQEYFLGVKAAGA